MIHRKRCFILLLACFGLGNMGAQCLTCLQGKSLVELKQEDRLAPLRPSLQAPSFPSIGDQTTALQRPAISSMMISAPAQAPNTYSVQDLAFFCRLEVKLEKAAKLPVKFRLGEVQEVERLEGKYGGLPKRYQKGPAPQSSGSH